MDPNQLRQLESAGCDVYSNYAACLRFLKIIGDDLPKSDFDEDLLPTFSDALEVFSLLETPDEYEIVQLSRYPITNDRQFLGFDIGYWGGDHYSIICDSAVRPTWHPPQPESFESLAKELRDVNEHFLFQSCEAAERFRSYYRTQDWAETEFFPNQFCIIQVCLPQNRLE
jgi:hypothetical protein